MIATGRAGSERSPMNEGLTCRARYRAGYMVAR